MGKVVGVVAAILVGLALATGVSLTVTSASSPDKKVDFQNPADPNNKDGVVNYGTP